jgi:guanylate kinase
MGDYDHVVVNDDLERAAMELEHLMGLRQPRIPPTPR